MGDVMFDGKQVGSSTSGSTLFGPKQGGPMGLKEKLRTDTRAQFLAVALVVLIIVGGYLVYSYVSGIVPTQGSDRDSSTGYGFQEYPDSFK